MRWSTTCGRRSGTQAWALGLGLLFGATAAPEAPADMSVTVPLDVTLGTPVNLAESFPIVSYRINGTNYDQNDFIKAKLTSTTNLEGVRFGTLTIGRGARAGTGAGGTR